MTLARDIEVLDEFLDFVKEGSPLKKDELRSKQKVELDMWHHWNNNDRKPEHLQPLFKSFQPIIQKQARQYLNRVELPTSAVQHEFDKQFVAAVKSYDPKRNVQLSSWVTTNLRKASRFIKTYQNFGKISEGQISLIGKFKRGKEELTDRLGHEPDMLMLADHLGLPKRKVAQLEKELSRRDLPTSHFEAVMGYDPAEVLAPKELEAIRILQYDSSLSPEERTVYEYAHGINGRPMLKPGAIAKKTGIHPSKISRIFTKLRTKISEAAEVL